MAASPMLTASSPVLLVQDLAKSANHYRDALGFGYERFWGEPPSFVILHRDGMYLMLKQVDDPKHIVPHWTIRTACGTRTSGFPGWTRCTLNSCAAAHA
jgi:hypothetical protein